MAEYGLMELDRHHPCRNGIYEVLGLADAGKIGLNTIPGRMACAHFAPRAQHMLADDWYARTCGLPDVDGELLHDMNA